MDLGISGERALVLGGSKGLGFACAKALADEGVTVTLNGRDANEGAKAAASLGAGHEFIAADLSDPAARASLLASVLDPSKPKLSILINNAGGPPPGEFTEQKLDLWRAALELNLLSFVEISQAVLPGMIDSGFGRIINITSFAAKEPYPNMALANGVRVALHGAMSTLAREVAPMGVTVNNLLPGLMDTGALQRVIAARMAKDGSPEETVRANMAASVPAGRLGTAEDFGPACAFLCSRHANYITAQNILIDGGLVRGLY